MADFDSKARPHIQGLLQDGEELRGLVPATQSTLFKGRMVALAATDRRLIILPLNRKIEPDGAPYFLTPDRIEEAEAGDRWYELSATSQLRLKLDNGEKLRLIMMPGGDGLRAVGDWFRNAGH